MKGTKKFYKELVEELKLDIAMKEMYQKSAEASDSTFNVYCEKVEYFRGRINATKEIIYKLFPDCTLTADLKQGK